MFLSFLTEWIYNNFNGIITRINVAVRCTYKCYGAPRNGALHLEILRCAAPTEIFLG